MSHACPTCIALRHKILHYALQCNDHEQILEQLTKLSRSGDSVTGTLRDSILKNTLAAFNAALTSTGREHTLSILCQVLDLLQQREEATSIFIDHIFYYYPEAEFNPLDRMKWCKSQVEKYSGYFPSSWDVKAAILQRFIVLFRADVDRLQMNHDLLLKIAHALNSFEAWAGQEYRTVVLLKHYRKYMASKHLVADLNPDDFFNWLKAVVKDMGIILPFDVGITNTISYLHGYLAHYAECGTIKTVEDLEKIIEMINNLASFTSESFDTDKVVYIKRLEKMRNMIAAEINRDVSRIMTGISFTANRKKSVYLHELEQLFNSLELKMSEENRKLVLLSVCRHTISQFKSSLLGQRSAINVEYACTDYYSIQNIFNQPGFICREDLSNDMLDVQKIIMLLQHSLAPQTSYLEDFQQYSSDRNLFIKLLDLRGIKGRDRSCIVEAYDKNVGTHFLQTILPF